MTTRPLLPVLALALAACPTAMPVPAAARPRLADGVPVDAALEAADPMLPGGAHYDEYTFSLPCAATVNVWEESARFDARMVLGQEVAGAFREMYADDDGGNGANARFTDLQLPAGTYVLRASSATPATGEYRVTLRVRPTAC